MKYNKAFSLTLISLLNFTFFSSVHLQAASTQSSELMCKNKAKEIAAELYKNCITDVENQKISLRKEYANKLAELKKVYEDKMNNVSSQSSISTEKGKTTAGKSVNSSINSEGYIQRSSGARELPTSPKQLKKSTSEPQTPETQPETQDNQNDSSDSNKVTGTTQNSKNLIQQSDGTVVEIVEITPEQM